MSRLSPRRLYSVRFVAAITLAAFGAELLIMLLLRRDALNAAVWGEALLDAAILVTVLLPALYVFLARPLERQMAARQTSEQRLVNIVETARDAVIVLDEQTKFILFNQGAERIFGYAAGEVLGQQLQLLLPERVKNEHDRFVREFTESPEWARRLQDRLEVSGRRKGGTEFPAEVSISRLTYDGRTTFTVILRDITARKAGEIALRRARDELEARVQERTDELAAANQFLHAEVLERQEAEGQVRLALIASREREAEVAALLASSRAVLAHRDFDSAARAILAACRGLIGADAGFVALLRENGGAFHIHYRESGGAERPCDRTQAVAAQGLCAQVGQGGAAAYTNARLSGGASGWPSGNGSLPPDNVLYAPVRVEEVTVGLLGLAGKTGGFTENDARMAAAFGELAAIALRNSRALESLETMAAEMTARADVLDAVFASIADAVFVYDASGSPLRFNPAAVAMYGGPPRNVTRSLKTQGLSLQRFGGGPVAPSDLPALHALRGETIQNQYLLLTNVLGRNYTIDASASPLYMNGRVSGAVVVWHDISEHERLAALEERQRLARELHDSLSQALYGIALGAHTARTYLDNDRAKASEALDYVLSLAEVSLTEMRALIFELRPESLAVEGLVVGLTKQAAAVQARNNLPVVVDLGEEPPVSLEIKEACFRVTREAVNNVVRHAQPGRLSLRLSRQPGRLVLEVADDGLGFDPHGEYPGHLGLSSMRERAALVGGTLTIDSAPGAGTRVRAEFPLSQDAGGPP
jgi:PAS domain S-box-containing protein